MMDQTDGVARNRQEGRVSVYCQQCGGLTAEMERDGRMRPVCTRCGAVTYFDPKVAAGVLIARDGRLLFGRRGPAATAAGLWSFPAGFVERGERVEDAAVREAREEIGVAVTLRRLLGLFSESGQTVILAVYEADVGNAEPVAGDDLVEVGWFAPNDLPQLAFPRDRRIVASWLAERN